MKVAYTDRSRLEAAGRNFNDAMKEHLGYVTREGAGYEHQRPELFDREDDFGKVKDIEVGNIPDEKRFYKIILSPEHGSKLDMKEYTRLVMDQAEAHLGQRLDWVAAEHGNTDNPHVHIVIRGVDRDGKEVNLKDHPDFVKSTLRDIARDKATEILGERTKAEIARQQKNDLQAQRMTGLDYRIDNATKEAGALWPRNPSEAERLKFLAREGLATKSSDGYVMNPGWTEELKARSQKGDILKSMNYSSPELQFSDKTTNIKGRVIHKEVKDELYDRSYVVIRTEQGKEFYYDGFPARKMRFGMEVTLENGKPVFERPKTQEREAPQQRQPKPETERPNSRPSTDLRAEVSRKGPSVLDKDLVEEKAKKNVLYKDRRDPRVTRLHDAPVFKASELSDFHRARMEHLVKEGAASALWLNNQKFYTVPDAEKIRNLSRPDREGTDAQNRQTPPATESAAKEGVGPRPYETVLSVRPEGVDFAHAGFYGREELGQARYEQAVQTYKIEQEQLKAWYAAKEQQEQERAKAMEPLQEQTSSQNREQPQQTAQERDQDQGRERSRR